MKIKDVGRFVFTSAFILFVLILVVDSFSYRKSQQMIPLIISVFTLICLISTLILDLSAKTKSESSIREVQLWAPVVRMMLWMALLLIIIFIFGFVIGTFVFCINYLLIQAKMNLHRAAIFTFIVTVFIYLFFNIGLNVKLWPGLIPEIIPDILGGGMTPPL